MARFDVYANADTLERQLIPYFLDVQNDHLLGLPTRIVVPLWTAESFPIRATDLNPGLVVLGKSVVMDTPALGAVPLSALRRPVDNLSTEQLSIQNALDTLFGSY